MAVMQISKEALQAIILRRTQNELSLVWHEASGPNRAAGTRSTLDRHNQRQRIGGCFKKYRYEPAAWWPGATGRERQCQL